MSGGAPSLADVTASRIFYVIERDPDGALLAIAGAEGPSVPIFSAAAAARDAMPPLHRVRIIGPAHFGAFAEAARGAGARSLELDPKAIPAATHLAP